jgi:hypothetical protein
MSDLSLSKRQKIDHGATFLPHAITSLPNKIYSIGDKDIFQLSATARSNAFNHESSNILNQKYKYAPIILDRFQVISDGIHLIHQHSDFIISS